MQPSYLTFITVSTLVCLSCHFTTVYGKCSGRWAIHACYGGNGKRSGPPLTDSRTGTDNTDKMSLLEQILLSPYDVQDLSNEDGPAQEPIIDDTEGINYLYPVKDADGYDKQDRQTDLETTRNLLTNLLLEGRFRRIPAYRLGYNRR